jgi:hypothetical protein
MGYQKSSLELETRSFLLNSVNEAQYEVEMQHLDHVVE